MIHKITKSLFLFVAALTAVAGYSQNLITNGDFESGGAGNGFQTNYNLVSSNSGARDYAIVSNPGPINMNFSNACVDHSATGNKMMVVDGATSGPNNDKVWEALTSTGGGGGIPVTPGVTYTFSYWIQSISTTNAPSNSAIIQVKINNVDILPTTGSATCPTAICTWTPVTYTWVATSGYAQIWIYDRQTSSTGNDFALDDISLTAAPAPLSSTYSLTNLTCINANDGTIFAYGIGGTPPYSYTLSGPSFPATTNTNGFFTGLAPLVTPGSYTLAVTDNAGAGTTVTKTGINFPTPTGLTLTPANPTICIGESVALTVSGGSTYTWSVSPNTETVPTGSNPTVTPTGTATYTVNSTTVTPDNLIYNGDFPLGNVGFTSDYTYYNPNNPTNAQKAYGVVNVANTWEVGFAAATDHTNLTAPGTGKMMVVDGSTSNGGNDKVWCQTVPVVPGQTYSLKYWIQSLALVNPFPAKIEVTINGVSQGPSIMAPNAPLSWDQHSYSWTAGAGVTTAQICFYDREVQPNGNDFALDDIVFSRINTCVLPPKSVTVTINNTLVLNITQPATVCAPTTVNLTSAIAAGSTAAATITYWTDAAATTNQITALAAATISTSGIYYIRSTLGTCTVVKPVTVTITTSGGTPVPTVVQPVYYCNGSPAVPLTATPLAGATLNWYASATTTTALPGPPTPSTAVDMLLSWWVSQTVGTCESPRARINVWINSYNAPLVINCDGSNITTNPATSVLFNWDNIPPNPPENYYYTYSINGGAPVSGTTRNSSLEVFGVLPGQSATITLTNALGYPCIASQFPISFTCNNCISRTTPTFTLPTSICTGSSVPTLPTTSNNGISGTWSPAIVSNTAGNNYVFTPDPVLFPCADPVTKAIAVANPPVAGTISGTSAICVGGTATLATTGSAGGTWSSSNSSTATVNTSGAVTGVVSGAVDITYNVAGTGGCSAVSSSPFTVTVSNPPIAGTLSGNQAICVGDTVTFIPTVSGGTWTSQQPAFATVNASGVITGVAAGIATIRYTISGTGGCAAVFVDRTVTVSAIPSPGVLSGGTTNICISSTTTYVSTIPGGTWTSNAPGIATVSNAGVITGVTAGAAVISYIVNGTGGCPASPAATINVTVSAPLSPGILNGGQTICVGGTTTFGSSVSGGSWTSQNPAVATVISSTGVITGVSGGSANMEYTLPGAGGCASTSVTRSVNVNPNIVPTFNPVPAVCEGNTIPALPLTSNNGITGTWSPALNNTSDTEYTFTPTGSSCATIAKLTINIKQRIVPLFAAGLGNLCQGSIPPTLPASSDNAITGTWNPPTVSTTNLGTTQYTFNPTPGQCTSNTLTQLSLTVVPVLTPNFVLIPPPPYCDGKPVPTLSNTSPNGVEGIWTPSIISNTLSGNYSFMPNSNQCAVQQTLNVGITPRTVPDFAIVPPFCKDSTAPILPLTSPNGITGTWNQPTVDNTVSGIFQYDFTPAANECATAASLYINVKEPVSPGFPDLAFCTGSITPPLPTISPIGISGSWLPNTIDNIIGKPYVFTPDAGECAIPQTINVTINQYTLIAIDGIVTNYFDENQIITVLATDPGNYLYQLDYGPLQQSNVFQYVGSGTHVIKVVDANGCSSPLTRDVLVINYPKFFTPNEDGYNNTWNISGLQEQLNAKIFIFDRYGKLLKQINPSGDGWNGTFNGRPLPADDYWFSVDYEENGQPKNFKAHFALKR
ncbi:T9SS type B sorting domain-containing protein [Flavobacterium sp.]|uniref:T9SS type B sorting domain-containing protein n=1 Tax=Flavobacterium sp. TaxID=239 RepID=UPI00260F354A|nr:T9SS type B sorting domain-containing protein [Flavobacterium sp.]